MNYYDNPPDPDQKSPIEPHSIISGALPGATEIRLGNNIKISGKNQQILVTTTGGNVVVGSTSDGRLAVEATNNDGSKVGMGDIPGTTNLGLYSVDSSNHTTAVLGKQADGSNSLKFFDASNVGLAQFGKFSDGSTALKVAKAGIEVGTATNDQLIFNSSQDVFKIVASNESTLTPPASWGSGVAITNTISHNLGFPPAFQAYVTIPNIGAGFPQEGKLINVPAFITLTNSPTVRGSLIYIQVLAYSDTSNLYLSVINTTDSTLSGYNLLPFICKYYILQETAS